MTAKMNATEFAHFVKGLGFVVYLAKSETYGFITDDHGTRVLSFSFTDGAKLHGNYGPPSPQSGTGWRLARNPYDLRTADGVKQALYELAPHWAGNDWNHYTTLEQHLKLYGETSGYKKV